MLENIKSILKKNEISFETRIENKIEVISTSLYCKNNNDEDIVNVLEIMKVDGIEEKTKGLSLVQFFLTINLEINSDEAQRGEIMKMISYLNYTLAIGAFILYPGEKFIYLKYNLGVDKNIDVDLDLKVTRTRWVIENHLKQYYKFFIDLNNSSKKFEELL
jgi:hypothetical protein